MCAVAFPEKETSLNFLIGISPRVCESFITQNLSFLYFRNVTRYILMMCPLTTTARI